MVRGDFNFTRLVYFIKSKSERENNVTKIETHSPSRIFIPPPLSPCSGLMLKIMVICNSGDYNPPHNFFHIISVVADSGSCVTADK